MLQRGCRRVVDGRGGAGMQPAYQPDDEHGPDRGVFERVSAGARQEHLRAPAGGIDCQARGEPDALVLRRAAAFRDDVLERRHQRQRHEERCDDGVRWPQWQHGWQPLLVLGHRRVPEQTHGRDPCAVVRGGDLFSHFPDPRIAPDGNLQLHRRHETDRHRVQHTAVPADALHLLIGVEGDERELYDDARAAV